MVAGLSQYSGHLPGARLGAVLELIFSFVAGAVRAAVNHAFGLHAVAQNSHSAVGTERSHGLGSALEGVVGALLGAASDGEGLVIGVATSVTGAHDALLGSLFSVFALGDFFDQLGVEGRQVFGGATRNQSRIHDDFFINPGGSSVGEVGAQGGVTGDCAPV